MTYARLALHVAGQWFSLATGDQRCVVNPAAGLPLPGLPELAARKLGSALAAGCGVVIKPAESVAVAKLLCAMCVMCAQRVKRFAGELGGHAPVIVCADADLAFAL